MTRRFEAGPALVALGALVLIVSLFLDWYDPGITAWSAFEVFDLLLTALAVAALVAAVGLLAPELAYLDRAWLPWTAAAAVVIVASQLLNAPPAAAETDPALGGWLALAGAVVMAIGTVLTFGRVHFAVEVEGRDPRRRVAAVDVRRERARADDDDEDEDEPAAPQPVWAPARKEEREEDGGAAPRPPWAAADEPEPPGDDPLATQPTDPPDAREKPGGGSS